MQLSLEFRYEKRKWMLLLNKMQIDYGGQKIIVALITRKAIRIYVIERLIRTNNKH